MRQMMVAVCAAALTFGGASPAAALHGLTGEDFEPNLRYERVYFHCGNTTKVHLTTSGPIGWDTTAPTQSVAQGAGCGSFDNSVQGNNQVSVQDSHFAGTYGGNIDNITVEAHNIYVGPARASGPITVNVRLRIDDVAVLGANGKDVTVTPVRSSTGASEMVRFTITNIGLLDEANDIEHDIVMTLSGGAVLVPNGANPVRDTQSGWVYDTTEVPSGLTFSPATVEPVTLPRTADTPCWAPGVRWHRACL